MTSVCFGQKYKICESSGFHHNQSIVYTDLKHGLRLTWEVNIQGLMQIYLFSKLPLLISLFMFDSDLS